MQKIFRTLGVLLTALAVFWTPEAALADTNDARIVNQDEQLRGISMHYNPVTDGDSQQGYAHRSFHSRPALFTIEMPQADPYLAYCIEITVPAYRNRSTKLSQWDGFLGKNAFHYDPQVRTKIAWIVHYSYPSRPLEDFAHDVKVPDLTIAQAVTGVQSAIWRLTDGIEPDFVALAKESGHEKDAKAVKAVYDYLLSEHNTGLEQGELTAHVALTVPHEPGFAGELYGPIVIDSDQEFVSLQTRDDITLVDSEGQKLSRERLPRNTEVYIDLSDKKLAGEDELTATIENTAFHGWLISTVLSDDTHGQTLVMVRKFSQRSEDKVKINWRAADEVCRDGEGKAMRNSDTGRILARESSLCVPPKPPVPAEPPAPAQPPASPEPVTPKPVTPAPVKLQVSKESQVDQRPELAETGVEITILPLAALAMLLAGGFLLSRRRA